MRSGVRPALNSQPKLATSAGAVGHGPCMAAARGGGGSGSVGQWQQGSAGLRLSVRASFITCFAQHIYQDVLLCDQRFSGNEHSEGVQGFQSYLWRCKDGIQVLQMWGMAIPPCALTIASGKTRSALSVAGAPYKEGGVCRGAGHKQR